MSLPVRGEMIGVRVCAKHALRREWSEADSNTQRVLSARAVESWPQAEEVDVRSARFCGEGNKRYSRYISKTFLYGTWGQARAVGGGLYLSLLEVHPASELGVPTCAVCLSA